jgi:glycosyltransferase involved in cell wall biosynthesis
MRVTFACGVVPSSSAPSGGARVMYGQLEAIARHHEVGVVAIADDEAARDGVADLRRQGYAVAVASAGSGLRPRVGRGAGWIATGRPLGAVDVGRATEVAVRTATAGASLLHVAASKWAGAPLLAAARYSRSPAVLTDHEVANAKGPQRRAGASLSARAVERLDEGRWNRYLSDAYRRFARIEAFTAADAANVAARDPALDGRVTVNPFGVEVPTVEPVARGSHLLFVGSFDHPPNVDAVVWLVREIMPLVRIRQPNARLDIVGRNADPSLGGRGVRVLGVVPDLGPLYRQAGVVLAPLRSGGGMRVKILEAMAYGAPVVTTSLGAAGLAVGPLDPAPVVIADDSTSLAAAIVDLLDHPDHAASLGEAARECILSRFTWSAYGARLDSMYEAALG